MDFGKQVKFRGSGFVRTECRDSGTRQPLVGSMRLEVGTDWVGCFLRGR